MDCEFPAMECRPLWYALALLLMHCVPNVAVAQLCVDEQHNIKWHRPEDIVSYRRPSGPTPVTVATVSADMPERFLSLDQAIRIGLSNSEVIRVLTGTSATSSGRTIYDTAIATTPIDQATGRFDPTFFANSTWRKREIPGFDPIAGIISGSQVGGNDLATGLRKTNRLGGRGELLVGNIFNYQSPGIGVLNPVHRPGLELSYTQPLLAGGGRAANEAPIVIARLELDRSYFQFKDAVQELVLGVVQAYWNLVQARTELWAREKQVEQSDEAFKRAETQFRLGSANTAEVSQPKVAYFNFRANAISARANVLQNEDALRNIMGLPPEDGSRIVPSTPPTRDRVQFHWEDLVDTAQRRRPDLIELNLILLADQQRLIQANNSAQPTLNAFGAQRWDGITGRIPGGPNISAGLDDNPSWNLGVTFEVPLGLRSARASARSAELLIARDRANITQGLHQVEHQLATSLRSIDQSWLQYEAFKEVRAAAGENLKVQAAQFRAGTDIFLNVLQAITDWGNSVSAEAASLTQYNTQLVTMERLTGTVLDVHGVTFVEERFAAIGPHGKHFEPECYPRDLRPAGSADRYGDSGEPAEESFDLDDYPARRSEDSPLEAPAPPEEDIELKSAARAQSRRWFSVRRIGEIFK